MVGPEQWLAQDPELTAALKVVETLPFWEQRTVWELALRLYARQARGIVTLVIEPSSDRGFFGSTMMTCTLPECLSNPKVTALCIVTPTDTR